MLTTPPTSDYAEFVEKLVKPAHEVKKDLSAYECDLIHMAIGISGEAGEILDAVKKYAIYRKALDVKNIVEELGDLEFYMAHLRNLIGVNRDFILQKNMEKLAVRYANLTFSNEEAQDRADKQ